MRSTIGTLKDGTCVRISAKSPNEHLLLFGISGSGKSTRVNEILLENVISGRTVIAFDLNGMDYQLEPALVNRIDACEDGIDIKLLDKRAIESEGGGYINFIAYVVDMFSDIFSLGVRQKGALREAVVYACEHGEEFESEMEAIATGLEMQNSPVAQGVYNKLWTILKCGVFRQSDKSFVNGKINVLSLQNLNPSTQKNLLEIMLAVMWRVLRTGYAQLEDITIVIDEFQNLSLTRGSVLMEMLREARKYGVQIILATQTTASFSKEVSAALNQAAVQLFFRPANCDVKRIAEKISPENPDYWVIRIKQLQVGQAVAVGELCINGRDYHKPVIVESCNKNRQTRILASRITCGKF